jgi:hypothetical protein
MRGCIQKPRSLKEHSLQAFTLLLNCQIKYRTFLIPTTHARLPIKSAFLVPTTYPHCRYYRLSCVPATHLHSSNEACNFFRPYHLSPLLQFKPSLVPATYPPTYPMKPVTSSIPYHVSPPPALSHPDHVFPATNRAGLPSPLHFNCVLLCLTKPIIA